MKGRAVARPAEPTPEQLADVALRRIADACNDLSAFGHLVATLCENEADDLTVTRHAVAALGRSIETFSEQILNDTGEIEHALEKT